MSEVLYSSVLAEKSKVKDILVVVKAQEGGEQWKSPVLFWSTKF